MIFLLLFLAQTGLALESKLVFEKAVEGKVIMGSVPDGNLILSTHERFQVLTSEGKQSYQANLKPNQGLVTSPDGNCFGITTYSKGASPGFLAAENFALYSANGDKLGEIKNPEVSDFYVSNPANLIVGISSGEGGAKSRLVFYDRAGNPIKSLEVGFLEGVSFSSNGKSVFVNSGKDGLSAFDDSGALKANFGLCEKFTTSQDGEYVAIISGGSLQIYHQGKPVGNPLNVNPLIREMCFSPDNKYISVIDKKNLFLFEVQTGNLLWQYLLDKPDLSFISVDISPNAEKIIAGIDYDKGRKVALEDRHTNGFIYLFDKDGKITWKKELFYKLWGAVFPKVQFSADGANFSVITREKIYLFKGN